MAQAVMYVSLWDDFNQEATFAGYHRQTVSMDVNAGLAANALGISWSLSQSAPVNISALKLHKDMWGEAILECPLNNPVNGSMCSGDSINFQAGGVNIPLDGANIPLDGAASAFLDRKARITVETFEDYMKDHPDATPRDVWEAAFVAGHQTAYTLLTGEPT